MAMIGSLYRILSPATVGIGSETHRNTDGVPGDPVCHGILRATGTFAGAGRGDRTARRSLEPERVDRIEPRRRARRIQPEHHADRGREPDGEPDHVPVDRAGCLRWAQERSRYEISDRQVALIGPIARRGALPARAERHRRRFRRRADLAVRQLPGAGSTPPAATSAAPGRGAAVDRSPRGAGGGCATSGCAAPRSGSTSVNVAPRPGPSL
jgi:hypothetical protein